MKAFSFSVYSFSSFMAGVLKHFDENNQQFYAISICFCDRPRVLKGVPDFTAAIIANEGMGTLTDQDTVNQACCNNVKVCPGEYYKAIHELMRGWQATSCLWGVNLQQEDYHAKVSRPHLGCKQYSILSTC